MTDEAAAEPQTKPQHRWQALSAIDRRVLGVLGEKAKTTPDGYPMSLNAVCTGSNQKSNRWPVMQLELDQVEESLDRLRALGAVGMVEGGGRVQKYRHYLYEWLGVDKVEMAVMIELLLRGDQTVGELRGRASRMEPIADLATLQPVLDSLKAKGLVLGFTPAGRGHVVSHALYMPREIETLREKYKGGAPIGEPTSAATATEPPAGRSTTAPSAHPAVVQEIDDIRREMSELQEQVNRLRQDVDQLRGIC
ncbi:MAG: YceH family protein [Planctomycetaceae bacterium]|nr:YceH family protein [Planctomycetaceae bacterium]